MSEHYERQMTRTGVYTKPTGAMDSKAGCVGPRLVWWLASPPEALVFAIDRWRALEGHAEFCRHKNVIYNSAVKSNPFRLNAILGGTKL